MDRSAYGIVSKKNNVRKDRQLAAASVDHASILRLKRARRPNGTMQSRSTRYDDEAVAVRVLVRRRMDVPLNRLREWTTGKQGRIRVSGLEDTTYEVGIQSSLFQCTAQHLVQRTVVVRMSDLARSGRMGGCACGCVCLNRGRKTTARWPLLLGDDATANVRQHGILCVIRVQFERQRGKGFQYAGRDATQQFMFTERCPQIVQ